VVCHPRYLCRHQRVVYRRDENALWSLPFSTSWLRVERVTGILHLSCGKFVSLITSIEVPTNVATLDDAAHHGCHSRQSVLSTRKRLGTPDQTVLDIRKAERARRRCCGEGALLRHNNEALCKSKGRRCECSFQSRECHHKKQLQRNCTNIETRVEFLLSQCQSTYDSSRDGVRLSTQERTLGKFDSNLQ
jgi:hypothetical protein